MRIFFIYIVLLLSTLGFSQTKKVQVQVDTTNIRIGEQFMYKILVDATQDVIIPKLELKQNELEVVDSLKMDTINNKIIKKYILTGFDSGAFYIPKQQIFVKNQAYFTDSLLINVATIAVDTTKIKKFPIKAIKSEPYQFDDFKTYIYWLICLLILVGLLLYYFVFRKKEIQQPVSVVNSIPPIDKALNDLEKLDAKLLWQNNKIKEYYSELTDIVRNYIETELHIPALEHTTNELIEVLNDLHATKLITTDKDTINKLKNLLQEADLVKFAKSKPLANEIEQDRKDAEDVVNNLKSNPVIAEEDVE